MATDETVSVVEASEIDSERLAEVARRAYDSDVDHGAVAAGGPRGYDSPAFYTRSLRHLGCYAVLLGGEVVGGAMVSAGGGHATIERLFVDPDHQRRGVGSEAARRLFERHPDAALWTAGAPEWNTRVPPFLESLGFRQIGWEVGDAGVRTRWFEKRTGDAEAITPIGSLGEGMSGVTVEGRVSEKSRPRQVRSKRTREVLTVANAALEDATGRVVIVIWGNQIDAVKVGDRIRVERGYTNAYSGVKQLNVGYGRLITLI